MTPEEIYDRYGERMYQYLALRLGSAQDAEDVLQETFCRLARYSLRWQLVRNPRAFIFKILRNESNRLLRDRISGRLEARRTSDGPADPDGIALCGPDEATVRLVSGALARLPDDQREVVILKVYEGFSFREIAAIRRSSINTEASRYRYALAKLRRDLDGKETGS